MKIFLTKFFASIHHISSSIILEEKGSLWIGKSIWSVVIHVLILENRAINSVHPRPFSWMIFPLSKKLADVLLLFDNFSGRLINEREFRLLPLYFLLGVYWLKHYFIVMWGLLLKALRLSFASNGIYFILLILNTTILAIDRCNRRLMIFVLLLLHLLLVWAHLILVVSIEWSGALVGGWWRLLLTWLHLYVALNIINKFNLPLSINNELI